MCLQLGFVLLSILFAKLRSSVSYNLVQMTIIQIWMLGLPLPSHPFQHSITYHLMHYMSLHPRHTLLVCQNKSCAYFFHIPYQAQRVHGLASSRNVLTKYYLQILRFEVGLSATVLNRIEYEQKDERTLCWLITDNGIG